jgi:hypothetical protein
MLLAVASALRLAHLVPKRAETSLLVLAQEVVAYPSMPGLCIL